MKIILVYLMISFRLSNYGERKLKELLKIYSGITSKGPSWRQSFKISYLQVIIVLNDTASLLFYLAMLVVGMALGVFVSIAYGGVEIWYGISSFVFSTILGAFCAVLLSERFLLPVFVRVSFWVIFSFFINLAIYFYINLFLSYHASFLFAAFTCLVCVTGVTYFLFKDRLSFLFYMANTNRPSLYDNLPNQIRGPIIRMAARDKYVSIKTEKGEYELRMTLSDAIEAAKVPGVRIHRSYWVGREYIT